MFALKDGALDTVEHSEECIMLERLIDNAKAFYSNPNNLQAFEAWLKNKEDNVNAQNHTHD